MAGNPKSKCDEDLISRLPDEIITNILSFIPTKSSVATSVLSKRWNQLWTSVPNLDFSKCTWKDCKNAGFEKFVDRVLTLNNVPCVRKFRLNHSKNLNVNRLDAWISSIVRRDAEVIDFNIYTYPDYCLPNSFFIKKNLVELKLANCMCKIPQMVCFPNLKTVHLDSVRFDDKNSMKNLLFGCPVLKKLFIESFVCRGDAHTLDICSSTLHGLRLRITNGCTPLYRYKFVIDTPNLRDLDIVDRVWVSHTITNASSLVKLHLYLHRNDSMSILLITSMPVFHNLIHLTVDITAKKQWKCLPSLLYLTPNLVTFVLSSVCLSWSWYDPSEVPHCISSCLECVKFSISFLEGGQERKMISYFLKNANVLKELYICTCPALEPEEKDEAVTTLPILPRSSIACRIHFDGVVI